MKQTNKLIFLALLSFTLKMQAQSDIHFMTFNIWQEGTSVPNGLIKIKDVIVKVNPDIVGFAEVRNYSGDWTTKIVDALSTAGVNYYRGYAGGDIALISKYPIVSSTLIGAVAAFYINIKGNMVIVAVAHLDYTRYACYLPRGYNGGTPDWNMIDDGKGNPKPVTDVNTVLSYNMESTRDEEITAYINYAATKSEPLILMGDFNEPSCLDWTAKAATMFDHNGVVIPWQSTFALKNKGFTDAYREFFPDETANPGITWPSYANEVGSTSWTPKSDERDRIDFIFHKGKQLKTKYVALVGPETSYAKNVTTTSFTSKENFIADALPWPSDHKAVFATITFPFTTVGVDESSFMNQLTIYPNPARDHVAVNFTLTDSRAVSIEMIDEIGKVMLKENTCILNGGEHTYSFDMSLFAPGVYICKLNVQGVVKSAMIIKE
jgi:endonuclease/exonuclease/phosphatase family metal-dependent hydrolase